MLTAKISVHRAFSLSMIQQCGRKIELRLNDEQKNICFRSCAAARRAYNWKLAAQNTAYEFAKQNTPEGQKVKCKLGSPIDWHREWVEYKHLEGNEWLMVLSKCCGQEALRDLGTAWQKFFNGTGNHPQFHRFGELDSFRLTGSVYIGRDFVQLPSLGRVKLKEKNYIAIPNGVDKVPIPMATVSRQGSHWYVSFAYKTDIIPLYENVEITDDEYDVVGVDLGVKDLAITSYGEVIANPKSYKKHLHRLKRWQRKISRRKKGSKNRKKAIRKVADLHRRITNIRINSAHQCTTSLTRKLAPKMLVIESLKPKNMSRNHKLASSVLDANFNRISTQLEYKCKWLGIKLVKAPQFYASSQYCSKCGCYQKKDLKLTDREWTCPHCGCHHDRDVNAARNLRFYGLWLLGYANQQTAASYAVAACPSCERLTEGSGLKPRPKDLRLQFFETQEQCRSLKQEIISSIRHCA